jgi:hypothetical protein
MVWTKWDQRLLLRLDAFNGLTFAAASLTALTTWDARLQLPFFHFNFGSGQAVQYQLLENSMVRLQPLHCSAISQQIPPL